MMGAVDRNFQLAKGSGRGAFPNIDRVRLSQELAARLNDANLIYQNTASLCGPAAFMRCLAMDNPEMYGNYVLDLYETGRARLGSMTVTPTRDCLMYSAPPDLIPAADWVALASLRDSENSLLSYSSCSDEAAGVTLPHEVANWLQSVGYTGVRNDTNVFFTKSEDTIRDIIDLMKKGHRVCMFINAQMIQGDPYSRSWIPNHWVMAEGMALYGDKIKAKLWSWAKFYDVPDTEHIMPINRFTRNLYGYVSGQPT